MAMGRPEIYDRELCFSLCERVREGEHIRDVLKSDPSYPSLQSWYNWLSQHKDLFDFYHACRKDKAEHREVELMGLMQKLEAGNLDPHAAKVLIDANKWLMGVYNSRLFGTKPDISIDDQSSGITIEIKNNNSST